LTKNDKNTLADTKHLAYKLSRYWTFKQIRGVHTWDAVTSVPAFAQQRILFVDQVFNKNKSTTTTTTVAWKAHWYRAVQRHWLVKIATRSVISVTSWWGFSYLSAKSLGSPRKRTRYHHGPSFVMHFTL